MNKIKLSVIIPAYNEAKNLDKGALKEVDNYLKEQNYLYEVLIIDDGSTDDTVKIVEDQIKDKKGFKLIKNPHGGKALTVISGMLKSSGEIAVFTDMDQATPIDQIENFFPKFEEGFDVVIGSRKGRKGAPLLRKIMGLGFSIVRLVILGLPFKDTQCGFKAFNQRSIKTIFPQVQKIWEENELLPTASNWVSHKSGTSSFERSSLRSKLQSIFAQNKVKGAAVNAGFDVETLFLTRKKGFKIAEVVVDWRHVGTERVQAINDSLEALKDVIRIRMNDLQKKYD